jgi:hypothetical protein
MIALLSYVSNDRIQHSFFASERHPDKKFAQRHHVAPRNRDVAEYERQAEPVTGRHYPVRDLEEKKQSNAHDEKSRNEAKHKEMSSLNSDGNGDESQDDQTQRNQRGTKDCPEEPHTSP